MESFALKDLLMRSMKKAHNQRRYSKDGKPLGQNMNMVVNALLGSHAQGQHAEQHSTIVGVSPQKTPWVEKQRRLLKKRSSEPDAEAALVSQQASSASCRGSILALYGVQIKDTCSPWSPKGTMVDLTLDDSSPDV
jgi:hypothetical protein